MSDLVCCDGCVCNAMTHPALPALHCPWPADNQVALDLYLIRELAAAVNRSGAMNTDWVAVIDEWALRFFAEMVRRRLRCRGSPVWGFLCGSYQPTVAEMAKSAGAEEGVRVPKSTCQLLAVDGGPV